VAITIREADLETDRDEIIRFLYENLTPQSNGSRFDWLYLGNPNGRARAWIAVDEGGRTIGAAAAFPRHFWIDGKSERAWVLGDFGIGREHRSLGPALQLQRFVFASLASNDFAIAYDFPSASMMGIYRRLGVPLLGRHVRHVKLIRADEKIDNWVRHEFFAQCLSYIGNWALRFQQLPRFRNRDIEFSLHEGPFGKEFHTVNSGCALHPFQAVRSAEYLNWRYRKHPLKRYCVLAARRHSELVGYGVVEIDDRHAMLAELCANDMPKILPGMIAYIERILREMKICSIGMPVLEHCHFVPHLRRAGFYPRESVPVIACVTGGDKWLAGARDPNNWLLLYGDRES